MSTKAIGMKAMSGQTLVNGMARLSAIPDAAGVPSPRIAPKSMALVVAVHAALAMALMSQRAQVEMPVERPILVSMVAPEPAPDLPRPKIQRPQVIPPAPQPAMKKADPKPPQRQEAVAEPEPHLTAQAPSAEPTAPAPAPETAPSPAPQPEPAPARPAEPLRPEAVAMEPPRFNADYLDNPAPGYPPLSRRLGEQGRVLLRVHVAAGGTAREVVVHQSSGHPRLDEVAANTVRLWKFIPARQGGQPVDAWVIVPITFSLKG